MAGWSHVRWITAWARSWRSRWRDWWLRRVAQSGSWRRWRWRRRGSRSGARADAAIVVDVTHATDAPGVEVKEIGKHELGSGAVISRGSTLHPGLFELLHETAEREQIPFTVEASARATGTDADAVHISRAGVPTGLVSIPIRYMHSPVELVQLEDVHACARLIAATALRLEGETTFSR